MKVLKWQSTGDVGISSATLASIACGLKKNIYGHHFDAPHDAADFRRCVALVEQIPEIRDSFDKVDRIKNEDIHDIKDDISFLKSWLKNVGKIATSTRDKLNPSMDD
jgi:hypothetical protein